MNKPFSHGPMIDAVSYQAGGVVSRTIVKNRAGSVTAFAFEKSEGLDTHSAPFDALVHILEGRADVELAGKLHHLEAGDCLLMPAQAPHAVRAVTRFKMLLTLLKAS